MSYQPAQFPFLRSLQRLRGALWRRRFAHWLVRTGWLALLVPTVAMVGYLWLGWQVQWYHWVYPMVVVGLVSLLWAVRPLRLKQLVYRLDARLGLRTQLITAFEVSRAGVTTAESDNMVVPRLLQDSVHQIVQLRQQIHTFNRKLWLETQTLIGIAVLLGALLMLDTLTPRSPSATPVDLPPPGPEPLADEVLPSDAELFPPPFPPDMQQMQAMSQEQLQRALEALADALRDQAVTRSVADALDQGDLAGAAENLRRLADQLGELSGEAQAELGDSLQEAADNIGGDAPSLSQPLEAGSQSLAQEDLQGAGQALEDLAEALDSIEQTPQEMAQTPPEEGNESGDSGESQPPEEEAAEAEADQAQQPGAGEGEGEGDGPDQATQEERLAVEGQPLELESDPDLEERVLQPAELEAEAGDERTEDSPFARQPAAAAAELGPDKLTYPWEKREIIRRYFTP